MTTAADKENIEIPEFEKVSFWVSDLKKSSERISVNENLSSIQTVQQFIRFLEER
jgi:hypothetical protein